MQKIVTNIWYTDGAAQEAAEFYATLFEDAKITGTIPFVEDAHGTPGQAMVVNFELAGQQFTGINGDDSAKHDHAMSLLVNCEDQAEVDRLWDAFLSNGGKEIQCGWIADKWGVNWQVWPSEADRYLGGPDKEGAVRATEAMYGMKKIDLQGIKDAYEGR
ncbi:VOC family protein [Glycomyces albidus]|jgi:predicted 3-demethylubiquinone-9 3-methyltransferase (glyoxalase superfamily)|uniref:VOC family protein n=1 Tax=Glycomyces albidus TaxID=2656774 RepID=A0A6L5G8W0_9ACTN|nr:VOC family protein [Glycomyces albidus]MQM26097.1 VOC family protein [Glycomyces albidus]